MNPAANPGVIYRTWADVDREHMFMRDKLVTALKVPPEHLYDVKNEDKNTLCTLVEREVTGLCWVLIDGKLTTRFEDELEKVD